jgi:hypothetical protein
VIEYGLVDIERAAARKKRNVKSNDRRNGDRAAGHRAAERFIFQPPADRPVDDRANERGENDYAYEIVFDHVIE